MIIGITAEWNPFHLGHAYMVEHLKREYPDARLLAVMSGPFVQRGEPALFDKWARASWAVQAGVDAVLELPGTAALQSADRFAESAVLHLHTLHCTHIAFGTESATVQELQEAARWAASDEYLSVLHSFLKHRLPYGQAMTATMRSRFPKLAEKLMLPNNLLGFRYASAIVRHKLPIQIIAIPRKTEGTVSATAIREQLLSGHFMEYLPDFVQQDVKRLMASRHYTDYKRYEEACLLRSRFLPLKALSDSGLFSEGLEHRWFSCMKSGNYENALLKIKNRRYPYRRLKRIGAALLLSQGQGPSPYASMHQPAFLRLLAMKKGAGCLLKDPLIPIIVSEARAERTFSPDIRTALLQECLAEDIFSFCQEEEGFRQAGMNYYHSPVIL